MPDPDHVPKEEIERFNDRLSRLGMYVANLPGDQLAAALKMLPTKANGSMTPDDFKKASAQLSGARALVMPRNNWRWVACACFVVIAMQIGILVTTAYFMSGDSNQPKAAVAQSISQTALANQAAPTQEDETDKKIKEELRKLQLQQEKKAEQILRQ